jgi:hypothetical protein
MQVSGGTARVGFHRNTDRFHRKDLMDESSGSSPKSAEFPAIEDAEPFDESSGPRLTADTVSDFLLWLASVPVGAVELISARIGAARGDERLRVRLFEDLLSRPVVDASRHELLLSVIGELRDPAAVKPLFEFVTREGPLAPSAIPEPGLTDRSCRFEVEGSSLMLRARGAEMLAYIGTSEAFEATLKVAASHPDQLVRLAAADGYLFARSDSDEAANELRSMVPGEDRDLIGLPRITREIDPETFDKSVTSFYDRHPEDFPPAPQRMPSMEDGTRGTHNNGGV